MGEGEGGMIWENGIEIRIISCVKRGTMLVWGGRRVEGSGWGTHVYLWWIHSDVWQNQYNIVKFKNKIKLKKKEYVGDIIFMLY